MAALRRMRARNHGVVVQVGSALAYRGIPLQSVTMVQLPAVNTPQFGWVRSRLPRQPQPVKPIYQPEVAARAIRYAAEHPRRREYWLGGATAATLVANAVVPGLLDRYLARTGYAAQQRATPHDPRTPGNLFRPVDRDTDFGAHGDFDGQAKTGSVQLWASHHHGVVLAGLAGAAGALLAGHRHHSSRRR